MKKKKKLERGVNWGGGRYEGARLVSLDLFAEGLLELVGDAQVLLEELLALGPPRVVPALCRSKKEKACAMSRCTWREPRGQRKSARRQGWLGVCVLSW
jgi:hypothetical protein